MPNKFIQTCRRELDMGNCGFDNDYADSMVRSQWQSRSTNCIYLLYRWLVAIFFTYVVISSMVTFAETHGIGFFFIYFTNWGIMINMAVGLMGALIVTIWHFNTDFKGESLATKQFCTSKPSSKVFFCFNAQRISYHKMIKCQPYSRSIGHYTIQR